MTKFVTSPSSANDWAAFWETTKGTPQPDRGAKDKALDEFWVHFFDTELPKHFRPRLLDAACGDGAVTGFALQCASKRANSDVVISCMDYSEAAIQALNKQYPRAKGFSCDANHTPFADGEFHIVASQFGLEYAGQSAFEEAARLVAKNGVLAAIVHMKKGAIFDECRSNLNAIRTIRECELLTLARSAFEAGFAVIAGNAAQASFREADKNFAPAVETLKKILADDGPLVAGGMIHRIGSDLGHMYQRIENYVPQDVFVWLDRTDKELDNYANIMASMLDAALDEPEIKQLAARLAASNLTVDALDVLRMGNSKEAAAWILIGRRMG